MTSGETIEEKLKQLAQAISPDEKLIENVMSRINAAPNSSASIGQVQNIWRTIMRNPITKLAVAAVIIIACFTGLHFWKSTGSGIALADVLTRIEQVTGYMYQLNSTMTRQQTTSKRTSNILVSNEYGIKMTVIAADANSVQSKPRQFSDDVGKEVYLLLRSNSMVYVWHKTKTYEKYIYGVHELDFYKEQYNEPHTIIKQILSCEHTSLGQSILDGITVEEFQTTDLAYEGGFFGEADMQGEHIKVDVKLWVDVNTFLPVRLEEDIVTKKGFRIHEVSYDFRWNVIINPDDFEPNIPENYRAPAGDIVITDFREENTIKSFRLWADAFEKYPVDLETIGQEYRTLSGLDPNSYKDMSDEERTRKTSEVIQMVASSFLYKSLVNENKDPAYYGDKVGPDDTNKVLLRWKLDDGRYRVIFGDLHAETVTTDVMKELETALQ